MIKYTIGVKRPKVRKYRGENECSYISQNLFFKQIMRNCNDNLQTKCEKHIIEKEARQIYHIWGRSNDSFG